MLGQRRDRAPSTRGYAVLPLLGVYQPIWTYDLATLNKDLSNQPQEVAVTTTRVTTESATREADAPKLDMKFEVVVIPVADADRSKQFYSDLGWRLDADFAFDNDFRVIQFTPPGSAASIQFGSKITAAAPGSARGLYLIVSDIQPARDTLAGLGVEISEVFHPEAPGAQFASDAADRASGPAPDHATYSSFATFSDPDGNEWLLQEVTERLPGRIDAAETTFASTADLTNAMRRASVAHGEHEKRQGGEYDVNWPDWYAAYMVAEQAGTELPT
jgi:catechol 2,3-dioxygenase-like lactoylglutathione lyase family enzyme